ncbi:dihydrofolate reductase NDAI_0E01260 [Naumovozyma dairenensis CBS 421]|uniref:Dihydrofolate reductase n=1 Tax=Naumovozyma dairenensis (strain ATCC 10597 / BCRC 20456 / CBS 421 / NBRC 0211 / NRRL Y-12639) TaxID=1071378 RepID=G0WB22_NAUDC|nr:hypothetical protein NDAI_0E01260 [Naumovozyma dairenensis CBS 421]CCD24942.1 hypothetical protein NDAI_0E01260 [Naumovozyma dairenensis CBS 421]
MQSSKIPVVSIVACLLPEMGIGFQGSLPWRLSKEMKYFRQVTSLTKDSQKKNAVIMGRKTWQSIPARFRPLPNRLNVVISRSFESTLREENDLPNKYFKVNSLKGAFEQLHAQFGAELERIYIIGGGEVYNQCYDMIDHWLITALTPVETVVPEMDTFLDKDRLNSLYQECNGDLASFVPPGTELPHVNEDGHFIDHEKGYEFEYTLYNRK